MKKITALLGFIALLSTVSFAEITTKQTADFDYLKTQGFSESTLHVVDTARAHTEGVDGYQKKYRDDGRVRPYKAIKLYFDPAQEDDKFGEHQIEFSNTWVGDNTFYTTTKEDRGSSKRAVPNL